MKRPSKGNGKDPRNRALELLSVDADAHLQKLTAHMFPSPALLPVELVRSALKRKAAAVTLQIHSERIVISDNGVGINRTEWQALACLGDARQTALAREKALACLQDLAHPGIGLLAVFCPGARSVKIENTGSAASGTLRIADGRIDLLDTCSWTRGTRIMISRRRGLAAEEKVLLTELCAAARAEITINGRQLKKKPLLADTMVSLDITEGENTNRSLLAIPAMGDVCRIWLLDQGIPWQVTATAPEKGMVFAAALETGMQPTPPVMQTLDVYATRLYRWLAENYAQFPERYQSRIEDLLFKQARSGDDVGLLSSCAIFRLCYSPRRLNLDEVRRMAASGNLYFIDFDSRPSLGRVQEKDVLSCQDRPISSARMGGRSVLPSEDRPISSARMGGRSVLLLTPRQKDFLFNHLRMPMVSLNAHLQTKMKPLKIWSLCRHKFAALRRMVKPAAAEITDRSRLRCEEYDFCRELETHWQRKLAAAASATAAFPLSVVMIEGRGLVPAYRLKNEQGETLRIRRRHPLTVRALQKFSQDRDNCELALAALMPGHFLTD